MKKIIKFVTLVLVTMMYASTFFVAYGLLMLYFDTNVFHNIYDVHDFFELYQWCMVFGIVTVFTRQTLRWYLGPRDHHSANVYKYPKHIIR